MMLVTVQSFLLCTACFDAVFASWSCEESGPFDMNKDHKGDREELEKMADALNYKDWSENRDWKNGALSMCAWDHVCCETDADGKYRVTQLHNERIGMKGAFPDTFHRLSHLKVLNVHLNYVTNFPSNISALTELREAKFGRNPICGEVPVGLAQLTKLTKLNCNFCCVSGQFPDVFYNKPDLQEVFWDGNDLTGTIPPSLGALTGLEKISFNLNSLTGPIPKSLCDLPLVHDCRIGSDTDFGPYDDSAGHPERAWLPKWKGNVFSCDVPTCIMNGVCNDPKAGPVPSPVRCKPNVSTVAV